MGPDVTETLLLAARAGQSDAISDLLQRHRSYLMLLARLQIDRTLQAKLDPADLVQEACMAAVEDFPSFRGTTAGEFAAWLRRILANKAAALARTFRGTQMRDVRLERQIEDDLDQSSMNLAGLLPDRGSTPSEKASRREMSVLLADAIDQLTNDQREVIIRHGLEGQPIRDVAAALQRSEAAAWKLWARALLALRQKVQSLL